MIETIHTRKCDICGKQMGHEHVIITWPDGHKDDVCHDCTKSLNEKLREMREVREKNSDADRSHTDEIRVGRNMSAESDTVNMLMLLDEFYRDTGFLAEEDT